MGITISVLDQSPIYPGETAEEALAHTVHLAGRSEELGFRRFWVSEHHDSDHVAGSSPEVLISYLLARTKSIRLGSGGVMLQHYSPYKVAENFNVLASLAPGRVDVGIGRAPGGLPRSTLALQRGTQETATLTDKITELAGFLDGPLGEGHSLAGLRATPLPEAKPKLYILGASSGSAQIAAELGQPYVFSLFINGDESVAVEAVQAYREAFDYSKGTVPEILIAVTAVVAESLQEAEELAGAGAQKLVKVHLASGRTVTLGTLEQGEEFGRQSGEDYTVTQQEPLIFKGTKEDVSGQFHRLSQLTGVDEFIVTANIQPFAKRLRSFELLSEALAEASGRTPEGVAADA